LITFVFKSYRKGFANLNSDIWLLALGMLVNRSGTMVLMFASLFLTRDKGFTLEQAGFIMAFFGAGSILGSFVGGWLTDRWKPIPVMLLSLFASGAILVFLPFLNSATGITLVIFFNAFFADMYRPANSAAIYISSTDQNRTRSISLVRLATNLGFSFGPAIGGFLALWYGYVFVFLLDSITSLAACMVLFFAFRGRLNFGRPMKESVASADAGISAYRDFPYLFFAVLVAIYGTCFFQLFASMPQYFKLECGYSEDLIGLLLALNGAVVVIAEMPVVSRLEANRFPFSIIVTGVLFIPLSFLFTRSGNCYLPVIVLYTALISVSEILTMPFMMNFALSRGGEKRRGQYAALYSVAYGLASILAPLLGLGIADRYGFDVYFWFFIGLSLLNAACFYTLRGWFLRRWQ
jgi:predicted MFS family arabinose efflux permease